MFHTFQSSVGLRSPGADTDSLGKPSRPPGSRRISTSNACVECRRRKIRCDGTQPCGQCQWYQHPEACGYSKPAQRVVPSRKLVDKLSNNIEQYKAILTKLYGSKDLESLAKLPREELLEMALSSPAPPSMTSPSSGFDGRALSEVHTGSDGAESLEALEQAPPEDPFWDEARKHQLRVQGISDDVNGLSMSVDRMSSYVGISSVTAALKVIIRCAPQARPLITQQNTETTLPSRAGSPPPELTDNSPLALPSSTHGQELLESYFDRVHPLFPLIDERKFWSTYLYANRKDSQWLCLLNMVFALGSLASSSTDNEAHYVYFNRSRQHLSLESFGSGNLEVLQALAIMSGFYMHYLNRPNEAHSLMGGALRMATALGLHREYSERSDVGKQLMLPGEEDSISPEMRRRIWWSLFCLDTWASTTTGRPSLGRMGSSITVMKPGTAANAVPIIPPPNSPQYIEQLKILPLIHASVFCSIATKIQDRLVESPLLSTAETAAYDAQVLKWYEELPSILSSSDEPCPEFLQRVRLIMKWRYQNIRIVLHRPYLLTTALRRCVWSSLNADEKVAVGKCRLIAMKTIEEISQECMPDLISGWNAVWLCFQACMVPLVSLFSDASNPEEVQKWKLAVETALQFFESVRDYSIAAKRSGDAVAKLYQVYKAYASSASQTPVPMPMQMPLPQYQAQIPYPVNTMATQMQLNAQVNLGPGQGQSAFHYNPTTPTWGNANDPTMLNNFWDDMMWDNHLPDMLETPFGLSNDYEYAGTAQDPGNAGACWMHGN
ncbi:fungal-specific transcription factor domain-containing protein [Paraphoma chrysanthemicola]|uniref:Fungal-specific transcription factor domain-containing protein n=1 Tax=Paraphoma chrysanthemicola TaxID=798071 RepID=A0A8K0VVQ7_9PLEO|nr:fungal-specific transcription factor domain-containing protein [Paraphoma chrysanthemicola]